MCFFVLSPADLWHILFTDTAVMTRWIILMESEKRKEEVSACETHFTAQSTHKTNSSILVQGTGKRDELMAG